VHELQAVGSWWGAGASPLIALLRDPGELRVAGNSVLDEAEVHGLLGVALGALRRRGVALAPDQTAPFELREVARRVDHDAHLALLGRIGAALGAGGLRGVALKGPLFGERYYAEPWTRATTDTDLLVAEDALERASSILAELGYVRDVGPEEERFRKEHHHLHLRHPEAPLLELHFHAYTGFGRILPSAPLIERSLPMPQQQISALRVLAPEDELVFLAVHAAVHRFLRLGWLYDLALLLRAMSDGEISVAAERARTWGFARATAFAISLTVELFGLSRHLLEPFVVVGGVRAGIARRTLGEPRNGAIRSATRLAFTTALCDDRAAVIRYAIQASRGHARRLLGRPA
jgi:hypothetical protein